MFLFKLLFAHRKTSWLLFLAAFFLLMYGLFMPQVSAGPSLPNFDKLVHFCAFFIVFLFGRFATHGWVKWMYWLFPLAAAGLLEIMQGLLVPSREFSYLDMTANYMGVCAAALLWLGLLKSGQLTEE